MALNAKALTMMDDVNTMSDGQNRARNTTKIIQRKQSTAGFRDEAYEFCGHWLMIYLSSSPWLSYL